jgi:dipeptidyl aminopeptidase/acylaminoacyl peptidase
MSIRRVLLIALAPTILLAAFTASEEERTYILPPEPVRELFERDKNYATLSFPSPDGDHFLVPLTSELSTLEKMGRPTLRLAMLEIRPDVNREWRLDTFGDHGYRLYSFRERQFRNVSVPEGIFVSDATFSHDGKKLAFLAHTTERTEVWVADVATGQAQSLSSEPVMATLAARPVRNLPPDAPSRLLQWTSQGTLLTLLVPADRGPVPERTLPSGPVIRETRDKETPNPTYPFLLEDATDTELFRYYTTSQLAELAPGKAPRRLGQPGMFLEISVSPDGKHVLAERIVEPLSYITSFSGFARTLEVLDLDRDGAPISTIREMPLQEGRERGPNRTEAKLPRDVSWRPDGKGLSLLWREASDEEEEEKDEDKEEDEESSEERIDRILQLEAPFDLASARVLATTAEGEKESFSNVAYSLDGELGIATISGDSEDRIVAYDLKRANPPEQLLAAAYDPDDIVALPGEVLTRRTPGGHPYALLSSDGRPYLKSAGYQEDFVPRPFIDRVTVSDGSKERVFEGGTTRFEQPLVPLDAELSRILVRKESKSDFPDTFLVEGGSEVNLTNNRDPFPDITSARRIDFTFTRRDGLEVQGRISLPVGYREGTRVPAMIWTYPREYSSVKEYQRAAIEARNHNAFTELSYLRWSDIWLTQGYALVYPDVPIIRKDRTYNDNYIQHLVDTLYAAIRKIDQLGYVDIDRIGHGGHSYGAFATANLLAHTPYFKAGIAGDGAYNRTLTPMGFQSERRFVWENPHLYLEMSPFFKADHIDTPLLMYHGMDDNNTGTFLIQSERMMQALTGLGKTAVLYMYPFESHGPSAKESYLDLWARWLAWFDRYVKAEETEAPTTEDAVASRDAR